MLKRFLAPPVFAGDEEKTRIASHLNTIILIQFFVPILLVINVLRIPNNRALLIPVFLTFVLALSAMLYFMRRGYVSQVSIAAVAFLLMVATLVGSLNGGQPRPMIVYYPFIIVVAGLLLGGNAAIYTSLICGLSVAIVTYGGSSGIFKEMLQAPTPVVAVITYTLGFILIGVVLRLAANSIGAALERARMNEKQLIEGN